MADGPNIGLIVPRCEELPAFYQAADEMGFHSLWFTEMLFARTWMGRKDLNPFGVLAEAPTATPSGRNPKIRVNQLWSSPGTNKCVSKTVLDVRKAFPWSLANTWSEASFPVRRESSVPVGTGGQR